MPMGPRQTRGTQSGYAMAALLVGLAVMSVLLSMAMPAWRAFVKREKEAELVFRGEQYVRAISLYQRKFANAYPPSVDALVKQRFLRRPYADPMTKDGAFQLLYQGAAQPVRSPSVSLSGGSSSPGGLTASPTQVTAASGLSAGQSGPRGGIVGVASTSTEKSLRVYNGRTAYNEWHFVWRPASPGPATGRAGEVGPNRPGRQPSPLGGTGRPGQQPPGPIR